MSYKILGKSGSIRFDMDGVPAQCGMSFISNVVFCLKEGSKKEDLYNFFLNEVILGKKNMTSDQSAPGWNFSDITRSNEGWNVNKFLLTDYKRHDIYTTPHLYDFCQSVGLLEGSLVPNPNSGHQVRSFEINRNVIEEK